MFESLFSVDNLVKTVDKLLKLGKSRPFVRAIFFTLTPKYGGTSEGHSKYRIFILGLLEPGSLYTDYPQAACVFILRVKTNNLCCLPRKHPPSSGRTYKNASLSTYPQPLLRLLDLY
jgi:hypothetical protein